MNSYPLEACVRRNLYGEVAGILTLDGETTPWQGRWLNEMGCWQMTLAWELREQPELADAVAGELADMLGRLAYRPAPVVPYRRHLSVPAAAPPTRTVLAAISPDA